MAYRSRGRSKRSTYRPAKRRTTSRTSNRRSSGGGTTRVVVQVVGAQPATSAAPFSVAAAAPRTRRF